MLYIVGPRSEWDVAVIGAGPAGLAAASAAAAAGAQTVVLERAEHPRYKTCGGGIIDASLAAFRGLVGDARLPARDHTRAVTFTLQGRRQYTRTYDKPFLVMVLREEFDDALRRRAEDLGVTLWQRTAVCGISQDDGDYGRMRLADGSTVTARAVVGADGSAGVCSRHVGVEFAQVDLGLEAEIDVPATVADEWRGRILLDWGKQPGSYGWVFPKGDRLSVGVIASRGQGERTKEYFREFIARLKLDSFTVARESGHLTKCRADHSSLRNGRVVVAGDAAGLLEPWTREGISFALRSGTFAGESAAKAAIADSGEAAEAALDEYAASVNRVLVPEMRAGRVFLTAFSKHPSVFHAEIEAKGSVRRALALITR